MALPRVYLAFRIPPYGDDRASTPADVAAHLLAAGKSSRLYRTLVRERRLAQSVVAFAFPVVTGAAMLVVWATANPGVKDAALEAALWEELARLGEGLPARTSWSAPSPRSRRSSWSGLQQVGERADQISLFTTFFDDPERVNTELERYRDVRAEDVAAFARDYLPPANAAVLTYVPSPSAEAGE